MEAALVLAVGSERADLCDGWTQHLGAARVTAERTARHRKQECIITARGKSQQIGIDPSPLGVVAVFTWVLARLSEAGLVKGEDGRHRCDDSGSERGDAEHQASGHGGVVRDVGGPSGGGFGVSTPTRAELARFDRSRKGRKTSNEEWKSPQDPDAKVTKMTDGRTHLAHKGRAGSRPGDGGDSVGAGGRLPDSRQNSDPQHLTISLAPRGRNVSSSTRRALHQVNDHRRRDDGGALPRKASRRCAESSRGRRPGSPPHARCRGPRSSGSIA